MPSSPPREQVPESGAHNECDYLQWSGCSDAVTDAQVFCDTCDGLECEGCLYRHMVDKTTHKNDYAKCCGCMWYYGTKQDCTSCPFAPCHETQARGGGLTESSRCSSSRIAGVTAAAKWP